MRTILLTLTTTHHTPGVRVRRFVALLHVGRAAQRWRQGLFPEPRGHRGRGSDAAHRFALSLRRAEGDSVSRPTGEDIKR